MGVPNAYKAHLDERICNGMYLLNNKHDSLRRFMLLLVLAASTDECPR